MNSLDLWELINKHIMNRLKPFLFCAFVVLISCIISGCGDSETIEVQPEYVIPENAIILESHVADVYGGADAIVTIISDDGIYDSCLNIDRLFCERNLKCTVAGAIKFVKPHQSEWNELLGHGTIDLVSHSYDHIRIEDGKVIGNNQIAIYHEIVDADKWFENWLGTEQIVYVCPENTMSEKGYEILSDNSFWAVRRGTRGYNSLSPEEGVEPGQWFNLMVQGICDDGVDLDVRNLWIDTAINDHTWLIEMWHNVMPEYDGCYQTILLPDAEEHLDYILDQSEKGYIWVATYDEAVKYIREKQNIRLNTYILDGKTYVFAELTDDRMSYDTFDQPLTVVITIPDDIFLDGLSYEDKMTVNIVPGNEYVFDFAGDC